MLPHETRLAANGRRCYLGLRKMKTLAILFALLAPVLLPAAEVHPPKLPAGAQFAGDVAYVSDGYPRQKLDVAFSKDGTPRPLVVWIHGGAFMGGDKVENFPIWGDLMEQGFAVATINYRLSGDAKWPAQITDCKAALRYLRAHAKDYNLDPARIAVWGSSAGGHLAALVAASGAEKKFDVGEHLTESSAVSCAVDMFGPIDFERMPLRNDPNSPEAKMFGRSTAAALEKAGTTSDFIILPGVGHSHVPVWQKERGRILAFFNQHLKSASASISKPSQR